MATQQVRARAAALVDHPLLHRLLGLEQPAKPLARRRGARAAVVAGGDAGPGGAAQPPRSRGGRRAVRAPLPARAGVAVPAARHQQPGKFPARPAHGAARAGLPAHWGLLRLVGRVTELTFGFGVRFLSFGMSVATGLRFCMGLGSLVAW